ncbi:terpene cyclase/mutase family protein [Paracrocinitomix mangrovi]|uniref:terpene cyclase/mutase family protein n=1 Tax=Paracrocinitomix mangrovi TaxID=2862509 RepID=UPI001C8E5853|nr:terpene cyclase/mutase family protein [Paracrocinitomix mangrovi]UKN02492.1 terpene cyclase/mutase family protein [Paracrocinitomix mangrovi]
MSSADQTTQTKINFAEKDKTYFWNCWKFETKNGQQRWYFDLPTELKDIVKSEADWDKAEAKDFLKHFDEAYIFDKSVNPNSADQVLRWLRAEEVDPHKLIDIDENASLKERVRTSLLNGFSYYETLQEPDGNWAGDYGGPLFLIPGLIIASYITDSPFEKPMQVLMKRNLWNHQNEDGGWGLHIEGESIMFGTIMQYITLRLLGEDLSNPDMQRAQKWILDNGGAVNVPMWGKFYLSVLNVYEWKGNDALLPEMWKFPKWVPFHPGKYWCHDRMIFLPMSYCYGNKVKMEENDLIREIRTEIYTEDYDKINWKKARKQACEKDIFHPVNKWYKRLSKITNGYEKIHLKGLRRKSLKYVRDYIDHEDIHTRYINIGPVNQAINSICVWHMHGKDSEEFKQHVYRWQDYLWIAEDGAKMGGYNGSQLWDTSFAGQALLEANMEDDFPEMAEKIYHFIDITQIDRDPKDHKKYWRDVTLGCWPFSTIDHAWAVTDCTSEGMKTALLYNNKPHVNKANVIDENRLKPAIDWLLFMQNDDGGWASYEKKRAPQWIEVLNPAMLFENIMVEVTYTECSSATMQGLKEFSQNHDYRKADIQKALAKGTEFIKKKQSEDGSWYGCWGVCFTYGTWFGIEGLLCGGLEGYENGNPSKEIKDACEFLMSKQNEDGSWGESFESCVNHCYIQHEDGQIINTGWALLGLMKAKYPDKQAIEKGVEFLMSRQWENGDFPQEGISGVFNGNCMETYTSYRNVFPLWALARYYQYYAD